LTNNGIYAVVKLYITLALAKTKQKKHKKISAKALFINNLYRSLKATANQKNNITCKIPFFL